MLGSAPVVANAGAIGRRSASIPPKELARTLRSWYDRHARTLPWRRDRDPYRIWVAEVLLQQTRVAQALPYYRRFLGRFPDVRTLARARGSTVLRYWAGAGYYGRARNLHAAARVVVADRRGRIPDTVEGLSELPGVGPYIASAVASLAFGRPTLALEANGLRVAARLTGEEEDVRTAAVRRRLARFLEGGVSRHGSGEYNEALMEFGEVVCRPLRPDCPRCPLAGRCRARQEFPDPSVLPRRGRRPRRPHLYAAIALLEYRGRWLVQRRPPKGLLGGLWEFPGGHIEKDENPREACRRELKEEVGVSPRELSPLGVVRHTYSHFSVDLHVYHARLGPSEAARVRPSADRRWVNRSAFARIPKPRATEKAADLLTGDRQGRLSRGS